MQRFILTGAPGAGKTWIVERLAAMGHATVAEAATEVIAREQNRGSDAPWTEPDFVEKIAALQQCRIDGTEGAVQFHDRSPICTLALARHLGRPVPDRLALLLARIADKRMFENQVFFVDSLDFITPSAARRIGLVEARRFGELHAEIYESLGYQLVRIPAAPAEERAAMILDRVAQHKPRSP